MKSESQIRDVVKRLNDYTKHHGGPFGEGVEHIIAGKVALKWVLNEADLNEISSEVFE